MENTNKYWFTIEPYVYINQVKQRVLLYNTLDGVTIESEEADVVTLIREVLRKENVGVVELEKSQLEKPAIKAFVEELRDKYMGDFINQNHSAGRPVQVLPFINYPAWRDQRCNFNYLENWLQMLFEVTIHLDSTSDMAKLKAYLQAMPENVVFTLVSDWQEMNGGDQLLDFLKQWPAHKTITCPYTCIPPLMEENISGFSYQVTIRFPIDHSRWEDMVRLEQTRSSSFSYIFEVSSEADFQAAERLIEACSIEKYQLNPVYTGSNMDFFKENVFLTHDDIFNSLISMKDLFSKRAINRNDFGKLNILPNGDIFANMHHPVLGNISTHSIYEIIQKEINEGKSWLRIRNQTPCDTCLYRDLCPSPSDYELEIGYPNLCHINK